jgi:hypothetical protein
MVSSTGLGPFAPTPLRFLAIADSPVSIAVRRRQKVKRLICLSQSKATPRG